MKFIFFIVFLLPFYAVSQTVTIDDQGHNPQGLAEFLFDNACANIDNAAFSSNASVAQFSNNGGGFPLDNGIIIRSGEAKYTEGPYTGNNLSTQENTQSDPDLEDISAASGQVNITDVAYLEFDFVPLSEQFSFNFLFASNEYGEWQCFSADAFAFLLTNLETGETINMATVPNSSTPISVPKVRDNAYNSSCSSQNPSYFDTYTVDDPQNSTINMRGYTTVMNASATLDPGTPYQLRMVIGDANDADYDSAIFIEGGSFESSFDLGPNKTICSGDSIPVETGLDPTDYNFTWLKNGTVLADENDSELMVSQPGTYTVEISQDNGTCQVSDEITFDNLMVDSPENISVCNSGSDSYNYDLAQNDTDGLGIDGDTYSLFYYASQTDLQNDNPIPSGDLPNYNSVGNQTIYIKIYNTSSEHFCQATYSFKLLVDAPIEAHAVSPIEVCYDPSGYSIDLTEKSPQIIGSQNDDELNVTYYPDETSAETAQNPIGNPENYVVSSGFGSLTLWARVENENNAECYAIVSFQLTENPLPAVDGLQDTVVCNEYVLPPLQDGQYYSSSQGSGSIYQAGDVITDDGTYYIYNGPDANGCSNQSSFEVTILENFDVSGTYCDHYTVPTPPAGDFYTDIDGPNGNGSLIPPGTVLDTTQTIYFYAELDGTLCQNEAFDITVHPLPPVDTLSDVVTCIDYTLPDLSNGTYYDGSGGQGNSYAGGDVITSSKTLYIFADDGTCTNETDFHVTIIPEFQDSIISCGSYILPDLEAGGYYPQPEGQGPEIPEGTELVNSQTIYVYAETTETPNCTDNLSFEVNIKPIPEVDSLDNVYLCDGESYILPELDHGDYFTESDRQGDQLQAGDSITNTQDIFINSATDYCSDQTQFTITVKPKPEITSYTDVYSCGPYTYELPEPEHGAVYTGPNGEGQQVQNGDVISTTQELYIYNQSEEEPFCDNQEHFTVYVTDKPDIGDIENVMACDSFVLPSLPDGSYYTEEDGQGEELAAGEVIDSTQTIYVYAENGDRFICKSKGQFEVKISQTPSLPAFEDVISCGSYNLPNIQDTTGYEVDYYLAPNGQQKIDDYTMTPGDYTIYVYATASNNTDCFDEKQFTLKVKPLPTMDIPGTTICVNPYNGNPLTTALLESGIDSAAYNISWYLDGELVHSGPNYEADKGGIYTVKATNPDSQDVVNCDYKPGHAIVRETSEPIAEAVVSEDFSDQASIHVYIKHGVGDFVYKLDDGAFQTDSVFHDVPSGEHVITVKSALSSCGIDLLKVNVIKYPKFFTPNGDGRNDWWNIEDLSSHSEAKIYIFDRYGKLLKQISPQGEGWDGTFNNKAMPSNDYWFKVTYQKDGQGHVFKGHFTLKR